MRYHIQTTPIWDAFKESDGCPLCKLYEAVEARLVKQYLNEAVMEPDYRIKVNKRGFCSRHLRQLFTGGNKLGISLQVHTRSEAVLDEMSMIKNAKQAKKLGEKLAKALDTCVICDEIDELMERYAYTVAQMFAAEKEFPKVFETSAGFCLPHFTLLLNYVGHAGRYEEIYAAALYKKQTDAMRMANTDLDRFTQRFDYQNVNKFSGNTDDALAKSINILKGHIVD